YQGAAHPEHTARGPGPPGRTEPGLSRRSACGRGQALADLARRHRSEDGGVRAALRTGQAGAPGGHARPPGVPAPWADRAEGRRRPGTRAARTAVATRGDLSVPCGYDPTWAADLPRSAPALRGLPAERSV